MADLGEPLTDRELDVLDCVANGASNREIAQKLSISPNTVKVHIRNIYTKLGVSSRTEATTMALQQGLLSMPGIEMPTAEVLPITDPQTSVVEGGSEDMPVVSSPLAPTPSPKRRLWILSGAGVILIAIVALTIWWLLRNGSGILQPEVGLAETVVSEPVFIETPIPDSNWSISRELPEARTRMAAAVVGLNLYQVGGQTAKGIVNDVDIYRLDVRTWANGAPKLTPVTEAGAVVIAGEIYLLGGRLGSGELTGVVEAYSPLNDGWRPVTSLPAPSSGGLALANDNFIYYFGGFDGDQPTANSYRFDPARQTWETLPPMQEARAGATGGVLMGHLYVVGGTDGEQALSSCEFFDPAIEAWSTCPNMAAARVNAGAAVVLNKLYVFGGQVTGEERFGEVYDPAEESWDEVNTPMMVDYPNWAGMGVVSVETKIYALGGQNGEELLPHNYVYTPLLYQFFIPAASAGGEPEE